MGVYIEKMPGPGGFSHKAFSLFGLRIALEMVKNFPNWAKENCGNRAQKAVRVARFAECLILLKTSKLIGMRADL